MPAADGGVLCAGNLVFDVLVRPADRIEWETSTWVDAIGQSIGGNGANTSYAIAKLGGRARLIGLVGSDAAADFILTTLASAGVDLALVGRSEYPTASTVALVHSSGARALLHHPGASREAFAEPIEFTKAAIDGCTHFHLANIFGLPAMRPHGGETLRRARAAGLVTSLDCGWDSRGEWLQVAGPCLPHLDILFVNLDEARRLSGCEQAADAARFFLDRGTGAVIVKLGGEGCAMYTGGEPHSIAAYEVPVVDTTGAGDCFAGAFLAAHSRGASLVEAAELANAVAALSIQALGAVAGLRSRSDTEAWMAAATRRAIL